MIAAHWQAPVEAGQAPAFFQMEQGNVQSLWLIAIFQRLSIIFRTGEDGTPDSGAEFFQREQNGEPNRGAMRYSFRYVFAQGSTFYFVQIMTATFAEAAQRAGDRLVCRQGCTQCCHGVFALNQLDALRLRSGMKALHAAEPALAHEIEHRAQMWVVENEAGFPGDSKTGLLGDSESDRERFEGFANEAPCPALDPETGRCDVYAWRPMTCRIFGPPVRMGDGGAGPLRTVFQRREFGRSGGL